MDLFLGILYIIKSCFYRYLLLVLFFGMILGHVWPWAFSLF